MNEILHSYKVVIPDELERSINRSFYFPDQKLHNTVMQQLPFQEQNSSVFYLYVNQSLKLKEIVDLRSQLESFLTPIEPFLYFLEHFHTSESQIFQIFVRREMKDTDYSQQLEVSVQNFAKILESVKEKFLNILTGAAVYADIASIADCFSKGVGIKREIRIISDCKEFKSTSSHDTIQSFENVFVLHQIAEHIDALYNFCHDFGLQKCMVDDHLKKLKEIVLAKKSWQQESIRNLCIIFNEIQELLGIKKVDNFKEFTFLELFRPLYTQTKELRDFMTENNFRGKGKDRFLKLFDLVTQACQHDEYNAEVLNPLYAVYYVLVPLNNPDLSFQELIDEVSKLDHAKCLSQLKTVNSNIDLIRMWFSKAEVS